VIKLVREADVVFEIVFDVIQSVSVLKTALGVCLVLMYEACCASLSSLSPRFSYLYSALGHAFMQVLCILEEGVSRCTWHLSRCKTTQWLSMAILTVFHGDGLEV